MIAPLDFIHSGEIWAITGDSSSGNSSLLQEIETKEMERVSFRHHFRTLANTSNFYYQQRFNSSDSDDAPTVNDLLRVQRHLPGYWTFEKLVARLLLSHLLDEQVIKLSNGETKRVLIACALIKNPAVLLLDHPLSGLDADTRNSFSDLLKEIAEAGTIVLIATNPNSIPEAVSHIAVMEQGKIVHHGKRTLITAPGFVHEIKINDELLDKLLSGADQLNYKFIVSMKEVTIRYQDKIILDRVNWTILQGERWSLSGPNGAGKSTLLSLINGDNPQAYSNDMVLFDRQRGSGESIWDIKKQTGYVSPEFFQYFPMDSSCLQVIESGFYDTAGLFRQSEDSKLQRCQQWMSLMNISSFGTVLFSRVPTDVQRLCLLARALIKNPALLILDEPTQGLDDAQQVFFTELINQVCRKRDVTLIYVSHYREHIPAAVKNQLWLRAGRVEKTI